MVTAERKEAAAKRAFYRVQSRPGNPARTVVSSVDGISCGAVVMVQTDHGLEPMVVTAAVSSCSCDSVDELMEVAAAADDEEQRRYLLLQQMEEQAHNTCCRLVDKHQLNMKLVRVERFFDGSKIIFYFTAENRVDFRALVKDLVQQFRTRIEMRQIGVRHETRMLGGLGLCGREFCCSSYLGNFSSVSIKMAKEQDLPLNPNKISGVCNRLFCCLAHEYPGYREMRRKMPKPGRKIIIDDEQFMVRRQNVMGRQLLVESGSGEEIVLAEEKWSRAKPVIPHGDNRK